VTVPTKLTDRFTETSLDGEIVIMNIDTGEFLALTGTAAEAWSLIDGKRDRDLLLATLASRFGAQIQTVAPDLDDFLGELARLGLVGDD
jgi:hypothetical protein